MLNRKSVRATAFGSLLLVVLSTGFTLLAQEPLAPAAVPRPDHAASVQDALQRPFSFPFKVDTPIQEVAAYLSKRLSAPVVVDRAALDRLGLDEGDTVRLELEGVRLKTGLKLLLDQLDMTYHVEAEDNLLIFTDATGTDDPLGRVLSEMKALHRDLHDVQDVLDEIRGVLGLGAEGGPKVRKPTMIEEKPLRDRPEEKPQTPPANGAQRGRPGA
jgi:hypothetical protein